MHMKRTADRLFGDSLPLVGAGRRTQSDDLIAMAATMGGNVRVGLEDSLGSDREARGVRTPASHAWRDHHRGSWPGDRDARRRPHCART